jgi:hypothetical protein
VAERSVSKFGESIAALAVSIAPTEAGVAVGGGAGGDHQETKGGPDPQAKERPRQPGWLTWLRLKNLDKIHQSADGHKASLWLLREINIARELTRINVEGTFKLIDDLPLTDAQKRDLYGHIDMIVGTLMWEGDHIFKIYDAENNNLGMSKSREGLARLIASRERREVIRPMVEEIDKEFSHLPKRNRVAAVRRALLKREDFTRLLPNDLKDPRFIKTDIESILFPLQEFCGEQLGDIEYEEEMTNGEPLDDLLRDLGIDPDTVS